MHEFSTDWFTRHIPVFVDIKDKLEKHEKFLEVGSFEGRSACWLLENSLSDTGTLVCIDNWYGVPEHNADGGTARERFDSNVALSKKDGQTVVKVTADSSVGLGMLLNRNETFDYIYIDGHHSAPYVLTDICMAFWMLNIGGIMHMDDYEWDIYTGTPTKQPKMAIDAFVACFKDMIEVVYTGYQFAIKRVA